MISKGSGFILFLSIFSFSIAEMLRNDYQKLDARISHTPTYDKTVPYLDDHGNSDVNVSLKIRNIWNIDQKSMDCKMNLLLAFDWNDARLANISEDVIPVTDSYFVNKMWIPEMFFSNSKTGQFHSVAVPNQIMLVHPNGNVTLVRRYFVHFTCAMEFRHYPFDKQKCALEIAHLQRFPGTFAWSTIDDPVTVDPAVALPQFDVAQLDPTSCVGSYSLGPRTDCLKAVIHFRRRVGYFLVNVYVPSIMIVMVSWTSFWIDISAAPARVSLLVTTLLTISTKASSLQSMTAEVSYVKAIDIWMGVCTGCVFFALIEFVFASYLRRYNAKTSVRVKNKNTSQMEADSDLPVPIARWKLARMDKISRILFPSFFVLFSLVYWIYYLI